MNIQANKIAEVISSYQKLHFKYLNDEDSRQFALQNIASLVSKYLKKFPDQPIQCILPGFPFKFPIRTISGYKLKQKKSIDAADYFAILQLETFIKSLRKVYKPGIKIDILMDAEGFMELEKVSYETIAHYQNELEHVIKKLQLESSIRLVAYSGLNPHEDFASYQKRNMSPLETYIESTKKTHENDILKRYIGLSEYQRKQLRLLLTIQDEQLSENLLQRKKSLENRLKKSIREAAYQHLWYQDTWRHIVSEFFPDHLRLTVHPQSPYSDKIGLYLSNKTNIFAPVPWQGVPLQIMLPSHKTIDLIIDYDEIINLSPALPLKTIYFARIQMSLPCFQIDNLELMKYLYFKRTKGLFAFEDHLSSLQSS